MSEIANRLNAAGVRTRKRQEKSRKGPKEVGGEKFTPAAIKAILTQEAHVGLVAFNGTVREGRHEPILDNSMRDAWHKIRDDFKKAAEEEIAKTAKPKTRPGTHKYGLLFTGLIYSSDTGQMLTPAHSGEPRPNSNEPHLYYESARDRKIPGQKVEKYQARQLEEVVLLAFENIAKDTSIVRRIFAADNFLVRDQHEKLKREEQRLLNDLEDCKKMLAGFVSQKVASQGKQNVSRSLDEFISEHEDRIDKLERRKVEVRSELQTLMGKQASQDKIIESLKNFRVTFDKLKPERTV